MGHTEELSDFKPGTAAGCYLSHKSVCEISTLLDLPLSTVSAITVKWKRLGEATAQPQSSRPRKFRAGPKKHLSVNKKNS